jgi:hypothetical protein
MSAGVGIVTTDMHVFSEIKDSVVRVEEISLKSLALQNYIHVSSLVSRSAFNAAGGFKENVYEDWELWISVLKSGLSARCVSEPLFHYRHNRQGSLITRHEERHAERMKNMKRIHADLYPGENG